MRDTFPSRRLSAEGVFPERQPRERHAPAWPRRGVHPLWSLSSGVSEARRPPASTADTRLEPGVPGLASLHAHLSRQRQRLSMRHLQTSQEIASTHAFVAGVTALIGGSRQSYQGQWCESDSLQSTPARGHFHASLHISGYQRPSSISIRSKSVITRPSSFRPYCRIISGMKPSVSSSLQPRLLIKLL